MPEIQIRPAQQDDIPFLANLDHSYVTDYVWKMEIQAEEGQIKVNFLETRLPRSVRVDYPWRAAALTENWEQREGLLVATLETEPVAYIGLSQETTSASGAELPTIRVTDLVVLRRLRRHGIGAALLLAGQEWGENRQARRMLLELQPKNYPYIRLAQKMGFDFCGYLDWYFPTHDIGLFFAKPLR